MTLADLLSELRLRLNYPGAPQAEVTARLTVFLNDALQEIAADAGIGQWMTRYQISPTFTSIAGVAEYTLKAQRINAITERTNNSRLEMRTIDWYRSAAPNPTIETGNPTVWVMIGATNLMVDAVSTGGTYPLYAASSSGSDTTQTVYIEAYRTGNVLVQESVVLTGGTRVQIGALTDHISILKFYVSAPTAGVISLYRAVNPDPIVLMTIPAGMIGYGAAGYIGIKLFPTPTSAISYYVEAERELPLLLQTTDIPPIPTRFHQMLVDGALYREYEKRDKYDWAREARNRFLKMQNDFRYYATCPPDYLPARSTDSRFGYSRLGPWFNDGAGY